MKISTEILIEKFSSSKPPGKVELKTQIMALINALLKFGAGAETIEFRLHLRFEFLMLGIIPLIEKLKLYENTNLNRHLEVFVLQREKDESYLRDNVKDKELNCNSISGVCDTLRHQGINVWLFLSSLRGLLSLSKKVKIFKTRFSTKNHL